MQNLNHTKILICQKKNARNSIYIKKNLGIQTNRHQQRYLKIMANRDAAEKIFEKPIKKFELEKNLLMEGLNQPICTQSKGFALMTKLGYKPGMSLGKKREGIFNIYKLRFILKTPPLIKKVYAL